jgi:hypothetical protein
MPPGFERDGWATVGTGCKTDWHVTLACQFFRGDDMIELLEDLQYFWGVLDDGPRRAFKIAVTVLVALSFLVGSTFGYVVGVA